ncbi:MAG: nucleoside-diphosphate kinase [Prolixibacteraceae bacterium]|nr:nucleoside-diphosphate kinase [Prolixibacteraceae bacterium]
MSGNITFTMIKPEAVEKKETGAILKRIIEGGFKIKALKMTRLTKEQAGEFYGVHKGKPFYESLITYMSNGPILAAILEKNNAVADFRKLLGKTDPNEADECTLRKEFAESKSKNAVHGSDSDENANIEANFFFSKRERF